MNKENKNPKGNNSKSKPYKSNNNYNKKGAGTGQHVDGIKMVPGDRRRYTVDENTKNMRRLYNRLMEKGNSNSKGKNNRNKNRKPVDKTNIVANIMKALDNNYSEVCFKHDGCRVLQGCIKYGNKNQRSEIIKALRKHLYELILKKYSIYLAVKMLKFSDNKEREELVRESILPNLIKLIKNENGKAFLNYAFSNLTINLQNELIEYYINSFLKIPEEKLKNLKNQENTLQSNNAMDIDDNVIVERVGTYDQENVRESLKNHLEKQLEKGVHKNYIFQSFLNRIFDFLDTKTKIYISELFDDDIHEFIQWKSGIELCCKLFTVANAKTRKKIIKKIKDNIPTIMSNDNSIVLLIKIILFNDDTKIVNKHILQTLLPTLNDEFLENKRIVRIFINILHPNDNKVNTPSEQKIISYKDDNSSKKDDIKRQDELIHYIWEHVFNLVNVNLKFCLGDNFYSNLLLSLLQILDKNEFNEKLKEILKNLSDILNIDYKSNGDQIENCLLADRNVHFIINKLLKNLMEKEGNSDVKIEFYSALVEILKKDLEKFLDSKAIFVIIKLAENEQSKSLLDKLLKKYKTKINEKAQEKELVGYQILSKIISK
jgi:pumilio family protein 6